MRALLVLLAAGGTAYAGNNELSVGGTSRALRATSADALTKDSLDGGAFAYARALDIETLPGLGLWAEAALDWGSAKGTMFQTMSTELHSSSFSVGGRASYELHRRVFANARVSVGRMKESLKISDPSGASASDYSWSEMMTGSLGLQLRAIDLPTLQVGLHFDLGYAATAPVTLVAHADSSSSGTLMLPNQDASLGKLNLSGPFAAFGLMAQF